MNIKRLRQQLNTLKSSVLLITAIAFSGAVQAVNIAQQPLFLTTAATPNIMFILDDSGSMDWDILAKHHWEASNYDRDFTRSWARGGDLNSQDRNKTIWKKDGIVSYPGGCWDRNVDGICFNKLDLNGDGDTGDKEHGIISGQAQTYNWKLRLNHEFHWNYPEGKCVKKKAGYTDAGDFLPSFDRVLAFISASGKVEAHSAPTGNAFGVTDAAYDDEVWKKVGTDTRILSAAEAADKQTCDNRTDGAKWENTDDGKFRVHTGTDDWVSAGSIANPSATTLAGAGYTPGNVGNYHSEVVYNSGNLGVAATDALEINGDTTVNAEYKEADSEALRRIGYEYLYWPNDNVYRHATAGGVTCANSSKTYNSPEACRHLQYTDFPNNYPFNATAPATATSWKYPGNENILALPSFINRMIQPVWPNNSIPLQVRFSGTGGVKWASWSESTDSDTWVGATRIVNRTSPEGTRHALNKWDAWPLIVDWRFRSSALNVLYYNPTIKYQAWPSLGVPISGSINGTSAQAFRQESGAFIRSNPQPGSAGYSDARNLLRKHGTEEGGFVYEIWHDDAGFWSDSPQWNDSSECNISTGSPDHDDNGWLVSHFSNSGANTRYSVGGSPTVRSVVAGTVDPATGQTVALTDRVCFTFNNVPNKIVDLWDKRDRVTVYSDRIVVQTVRRTPHLFGESKDSDNTKKYAMSDTRVLSQVTYLPADYAAYSSEAFCIAVLGRNPDDTSKCKTLDQVQENVGTWFEYSRRRSFVAKGAIAQLIQTLPDLNYGLMGTSRNDTVSNNASNNTDLSIDVSQLFRDVYDGSGSGNGDSDLATHNASIQASLYNHAFRESGTPLRQALQRAGEYFAGRGPVLGAANSVDDHSTSPITSECQKNFAIILTDGYWSGLDPVNVLGLDGSGAGVTLNNADGDGHDKTLADVAKYYYDEDLSNLNNKVPTNTFNKNKAQHLTTVGIGFGVNGDLEDGNSSGWPGSVAGGSSLTEAGDWGDPHNVKPQKIDDLWHAAYNSRGLYFSAEDPDDLINRLNKAVLFASETEGSASAVTANSHVLTDSTRIYQTTFKNNEWSGDVQSFGLTANGLVVKPELWSAKALLDGVTANSRKIITLGLDGSGNDEGIPFRWADLVDASAATATVPDQQQALRTRWSSGVVESVAFGKDQLNYIRGATDAQFRDRSGHKLGDIVHSEPLYVGPPAQIYSDSLEAVAYSGFRSTHSGRDAMLYVGANDGMLHAFDASDGSEKFAYIPRVLIPSLNQLSHKNTATTSFSHRYFVDDTPVSNDVFFAGAWHTVLVGGLRGGGKGIYALDVTTIPLDAEASAGSLDDVALWEFTDANDVDMGYSFSKPSIVRLNNGNWAAIFGNGYDSANGKAVLYIVEFNSDTEYGTVHKFDTGIGSAGTPNGLSTPTVIDTDGDLIADRVYAGDLLGNVWSFDISDNNDGNWALSYGAATPLFTATNDAAGLQPITAPISVEVHPSGAIAGYLLHFGTGKFFSSTDNDEVGQQTQSIYALWDYGSAGITRADLWKHEIIAEVTHAGTGAELRVTSDDSVPSTRNANPFSWITTGQIGDVGWQSNVDRKGWRMDLINVEGGNTDNHGERIVSPVVFHGNSVIYSTLLPGGDPCEGGGSGWLMTLNGSTGARFAQTPFDINADGTFNSSDFAAWGGGTGTAASGVKSAAGIPSVPIILNAPGGQAVVISDHSTAALPDDGNGTAIGDYNTGPNQPSFDQGGGLVNGETSLGRKSWIELD